MANQINEGVIRFSSLAKKIGLDYLKTFQEKPIFSFFFTFASKVFL